MTCPKCHAKMRQYERNGVTIDQCTECRGIFLDRGELEHLIDADAQFNAEEAVSAPAAPPQQQAAAPPPPSPPAQAAPGHHPPPPAPYGHGQPYYRHAGPYYKHRRYGQGKYGYKRRKSFFESLFD